MKELLLKIKEFLKKYATKRVLSVLGIIILAVAIVFGGIGIYNYGKTAYLKPYQEKYKVEYPEGILEEMCDAYGKDTSTKGSIEIPDAGAKINVSSIIQNNSAFLENGAYIEKKQHFTAIRLADRKADIESLYSTADLFLKASQEIKLTTLFEKESFRVVAAYYINTNPEDDRGYVFPYNFCGNMKEKDFEFFEDAINHKTLYKTDYEFSYDDYFLSVSAPSDFMKDFRFVILCVKNGKSGFEKSETAKPNDKIFFPQVWYDANNEDNPYKFTGKWQPK
ncbi:MAG: hypothetical protein IKI34_01800 [Eubacterium sp.]|nr:hypothetical protein [Eubacterium sp.]